MTLDGEDIYLGGHGSAGSRQKYDQLISQWTAGGRKLPSETHAATIAEIVDSYSSQSNVHVRKPARHHKVARGIPTDSRIFKDSKA